MTAAEHAHRASELLDAVESAIADPELIALAAAEYPPPPVGVKVALDVATAHALTAQALALTATGPKK